MSDRLRLVVMGDSFVGKSSLIRRFLFDSFSLKYSATVEDLFSHDFELGDTALKVDILDTAGDAQFPVMRRLSIASAHAFLLVYSVTDPTSFNTVKTRLAEIREQRKDFEEVPIVIAANKIDLVREVEASEVTAWVSQHLRNARAVSVECSAFSPVAEDGNVHTVNQVFKAFLGLSKINFAPKCGFKDDIGLRRNFSAYGRLKSPLKSNGNNNNREAPQPPPLKLGVTKTNSGGSGLERKFLGLNLGHFGHHDDHNEDSKSEGSDASLSCLVSSRSSKRSRSLIRRSSKKAKQQINRVHNPDDCVIS